MKTERVKIDALVRVNNSESNHYLRYGEIKSLPVDDINGYIKVMVDKSDKSERTEYNEECWFNAADLDLISLPVQ